MLIIQFHSYRCNVDNRFVFLDETAATNECLKRFFLSRLQPPVAPLLSRIPLCISDDSTQLRKLGCHVFSCFPIRWPLIWVINIEYQRKTSRWNLIDFFLFPISSFLTHVRERFNFWQSLLYCQKNHEEIRERTQHFGGKTFLSK